MTTTAAEREALAYARKSLTRANAEIRLLACVCRLGRRGLALTREAGVTAASMSQDDTRAVLVALELADTENIIGDVTATARLVRESLRLAQCWDDGETRTWMVGLRWGIPALGELFRGLAEYEAEERIGPVLAALTATAQGVAA
jgi:hypothetical protein